MSSGRGRKRRAPARFDEASSIVGDRSGRGTDDLVTIPRRASSTVTSRSVAKTTRSSSAVASTMAPPPVFSAVATSDAVVSLHPRSTSAAPRRSTSAAAPRRSTSAAAPRRSTSAAAPRRSTSAAAPRRSTSAAAPRRSTSAAAPRRSTSAAAPRRSTSAAAPRRSTSAAAPRRSTSAAAPRRSTSAAAPRRSTSAAAPRRSTSAAPSARRAPRRVPSPVDEEAVYIRHEDAVSSDGEGTHSDDMPAQMAEMRREMAAMHNLVHVMASTSAQPIAGPSTAAAQPIAGPSTSGAHPLAGCSTAAAQPIAALSSGVGIVGERPNNMASFSSVPLGSLVDPKIKAKIGAGQFVELDSLVGEFSESPVLIFDVNNRNPSVQMRDNVSRRIFNVGQWTDAFLVYVAIYTECHPTEVASILKYVQLVRSMAASARNNMFIAYDRDFRKLRAHNNMPWDVIHQELYMALSHRNQNVSHNPRPTQGNNGKQPFRGGVCYAFASSGRCRRNNCPYSHACSKCGGNHHPKAPCNQPNKTPFAVKPTNPGNRR